MSSLRAVVLSDTRVDAATAQPSTPPAGLPGKLFVLLVLAGDAGVAKARAAETLGSLGSGLAAAAARLRTWLRTLDRGFDVSGESDRFILTCPADFTSDWAEFDEHCKAARGYERMSPNSPELAECWSRMSAATALLPQGPAKSVLPALTEHRDAGLVSLYLIAVVKAQVDHARIGLRLGHYREVDERLEALFHMNRQDEVVAELFARAKHGRGQAAAALKVISEHETAIADLGVQLCLAMTNLRNEFQERRPPDGAPRGTVLSPSSSPPRSERKGLDRATVPPRWTLNTTIPESFLASHAIGETRGHGSGFEGDWFQLTYEFDDVELAGRPCSLELVEASLSRERLRGTFTRLWRDNLSRRWVFEGRTRGATVSGDYQPLSDSDGLPGIFQLSQRTCCLCEGWFISLSQRTWSRSVSHEFDLPARIIWVRGTEAVRQEVSPYLAEVKEAMSTEHQSRLLNKVARLILGRHDTDPDESAWERFCYGNAHVDNAPALAVERHRRERPNPVSSDDSAQ